MMRFLSWLVTHCPTALGGSQWDFLLCSVLAWLEVRLKSYLMCSDFEVRIQGLAAGQCPQEQVRISVSGIVKQTECFLLDAWTQIYEFLRVLILLVCCPQIKKMFRLQYDFFQIFWYTFFSNYCSLFVAPVSAVSYYVWPQLHAFNLRLPARMCEVYGIHGCSCLWMRMLDWFWSWTSSLRPLCLMYWRSCHQNWLVNGQTSL